MSTRNIINKLRSLNVFVFSEGLVKERGCSIAEVLTHTGRRKIIAYTHVCNNMASVKGRDRVVYKQRPGDIVQVKAFAYGRYFW